MRISVVTTAVKNMYINLNKLRRRLAMKFWFLYVILTKKLGTYFRTTGIVGLNSQYIMLRLWKNKKGDIASYSTDHPQRVTATNPHEPHNTPITAAIKTAIIAIHVSFWVLFLYQYPNATPDLWNNLKGVEKIMGSNGATFLSNSRKDRELGFISWVRSEISRLMGRCVTRELPVRGDGYISTVRKLWRAWRCLYTRFNFDSLWIKAYVVRLFCRSIFVQVSDGGGRGLWTNTNGWIDAQLAGVHQGWIFGTG